MLLVIITFGILTGHGALARCEPHIIASIREHWNGHLQYVTPQIVETTKVTYLYAPSFLMNQTAGLRCYQTVFHPNGISATDYIYYDDPSMSSSVSYNFIEKGPGILVLYSAPIPNDHVYIAYLNNGVIGFYQCGDGYDSFINVAIIADYEVDYETVDAIAEAEALLLSLGKPFRTVLRTDC